MYYSNILVKGPVGKVVEENGHTSFIPCTLEKQVKAIDISSKDDDDSAVDITEDAEIWVSFTYSVFWDEFEENQDIQGQQYYVYRDECKLDRFRRRKHDHGFTDDVDISFYLCIIIAIWFGLLLVVTWALLKNSFKRRTLQISNDTNSNLHQGVHGDGCRCPPNSSLLGAFLGNGTQLLVMICSFLFLSYQGALYPCNAKAVSTYILAAYGLTSAVAGYVATTFHGARSFLVQSVLFAITQLGVGGIIWHFVTPRVDQAPCAFSQSQTHISGQPWYSRTIAQMFFRGLLPFTAIFWKMDDIYASLWKIKVFGAFSTMISAFVVVVSLTVLFAMAFTRYQLSKQDHDWRWRSLLRGGSPAIFMFVYGIYFHARISGDDFKNMVFVMGYNVCIFYAFFLVLGTIGYFASSVVFQHMYRGQQKND